MATKISPKDCGHNAGVQLEDWARPGTEDQDSFLIVRCESCDQIITVMREGHWGQRFSNLNDRIEELSIDISDIASEITLTGKEYVPAGHSIKERLEEVAAHLKKIT